MRYIAALLGALFALPVLAQDIDINALKAKIAARAVDYGALVEILEGPDGSSALAAFDVMLETGSVTLTEIAIDSALTSTDTKLRARALWEALARRDNVVVEIDTAELKGDEEAIAYLQTWYGASQSWPFYGKFPATQCINLSNGEECRPGRQLTVSGLKVDMTFSPNPGFTGTFTLEGDGVLRGTATSQYRPPRDYPATISFR